MPFNSMDIFATDDSYQKMLKKELGKLNSELSDFYFFDEAPVNGGTGPILLVGDIKDSIAKTLKSAAKSRAVGKCFMEDKTLKMTIVTGKMPDTAVKPIFQKNTFKFKVINSLPDAPDDDGKPSREEVNARAKLKATTGRFDKIKGQITDDERKELRIMFGDAVQAAKDKNWASVADLATQLDTKILEFAKAALKGASDDKAGREDGQKTLIATLVSKIKTENETLDKLEAAVTREEQTLKDLTATLAKITKPSDAAKKRDQIVACEGRIADAKKKVAESGATATAAIKELEAQKLNAESSGAAAIKLATTNIQNRIDALNKALDDVPIATAKQELKGVIEKMAEAAAWQKEQMGDARDHGSNRHGAQTGLERQARRTATTENITPDQPDNPMGVAGDQTLVWNKVKITYKEEAGTRVVANRAEVAGQIVGVANRGSGSSDVTETSMWASPVLEKEAYETAEKYAAKLKKFTHYKNSRGWGEFKSLTLVIPKPGSAPGWGYAVKRTGAAIDKAVAEAVLKDFEKGKITLDKLFDRMNSKLVGATETDKAGKEHSSAKMIPHATFVFERPSGGDAWKVVTRYPDSTAVAGWDIGSGDRATRDFKEANGNTTTLQGNRLP